MIIATTSNIERRAIDECRGIVVSEAIMGANVVRDIFARISDIVHDRDTAVADLKERARLAGADTVAGAHLDGEVAGQSMTMVSASRTDAVLG